MRFRAHWALARAVVIESLRRKDLWVVAILGFVIMLASGAIGLFGAQGLEVFAKDLGLSVLSLLASVIAIVVSTRLLPDEIKQRTLYPLLARPLTRADFLIGKLFGAILTSWIGFLLLAGMTAVALTVFHVQFEPIMAQYLLLKALGLIVVCSVGMTLSAFMSPNAASTLSLVIVFGAGIISRGLTMAYPGASTLEQALFKVVNAFVPQVSLFDIGSRAANIGWSPVPVWVVTFLLAYAVVYSSAMLSLAWVRFRSRAL